MLFKRIIPSRVFTSYLKNRSDERSFPVLIKELSQYFTLLGRCQNKAIVQQTLAISPPINPDDFACLEGTRSRLMEACTFFNAQSLEGVSMKNSLNKALAQGAEEATTRAYVDIARSA